jgi:hypothetical protein
LGLGALGLAQIEGNDRGVPPIDSSANFEVGGVAVDVSAKTADQARTFGWRLAQRRGWAALWARVNHSTPDAAPKLSDGQLDAITAGIEVEDEEIGPTRYIAHLGVLFDRARAGPFLGTASAGPRSVPMLVIPVMWSGGVAQSFEHRTEWQKAWARFRSGGSSINYVRPVGTGLDPLILNWGQAIRPGRARWRQILDQYGASDVVVPVVQIVRAYPGGPVTAHFLALHGPDAEVIARFDLFTPDSDGLPRMLDEGVRRIDAAYGQALVGGDLGPDQSLSTEPAPAPDLPEETPVEQSDTALTSAAALPGATSTFVVQVDTPDDNTLVDAQRRLRDLPGVSRVTVDSTALGGVSVLRLAFNGDADAFRAALTLAGYTAEDTGGGLRLRRAGR